jgi:hypothetical protein
MAKRVKKKKSGDGDNSDFPKKLWDKLPENWRDAAETKTTEELEKDLISSVKSMSQTYKDMKNDPKLSVLMEDVKALKGAFMDTILTDKAKIEYVIHLFNNRGVKTSVNTSVDDDDEE